MIKSIMDNRKGALIAGIIVGVGTICLALSGAKVGQIAYEKSQTDAIADQFQEQAQYLAEQAPTLGASGDLAVKEAFRLNEASEKLRDQSLQIYSKKMLDEAIDLGAGLALGKTIELAGKTGKAINLVRDLKAIGAETITAYTYSKADKQIWETIKGSRDNIDDFHLAIYKAELDEVAKMRTELQQSSKELEELFRRHEEAQRYIEESRREREERATKQQEEIVKLREQKRLESLKDEFILDQLKWIIYFQEPKEETASKEPTGKVVSCNTLEKIIKKATNNSWDNYLTCLGEEPIHIKYQDKSSLGVAGHGPLFPPAGEDSWSFGIDLSYDPDIHKKTCETNWEILDIEGIKVCRENTSETVDFELFAMVDAYCVPDSPGIFVKAGSTIHMFLENGLGISVSVRHQPFRIYNEADIGDMAYRCHKPIINEDIELVKKIIREFRNESITIKSIF